MKRFRFTLLVVCLVLIYLGGVDLQLMLRNPRPVSVDISELEKSGPEREWLTIRGGYQNLLEAISTTGSVEVDAFLVPIKTEPEAEHYRVLLETRDPQIVDALITYYFKLDSEKARRDYVDEHRELFYGQRDVTGMVMTGLIGTSNRNRLQKLAKDFGVPVPEDAILVTEGKEPARVRGFFFMIVALLGLVKFATMWRKSRKPV
jgi:hypothetical protein